MGNRNYSFINTQNMNKNEQETVNYKKKYRKSLRRYIAMIHMVALFKLSKADTDVLFTILDEPAPTEWEWYKIFDQDNRIKTLFSRHCFYTFSDDYPKALCYAHEKIEIMCN